MEASLRLDAVASAGLRVSRAKAADLAKRGDLRCAAQHDAWSKRVRVLYMWPLTWPGAASCGALRSMAHGARGSGFIEWGQ